MLKVILWIMGIAVVVFAGLVAIGYTQEQKAKSFIESYGGKDVRVLGNNDRIMCSNGVGLLLTYTIDGKQKYQAVCTSLIDDTELGLVR